MKMSFIAPEKPLRISRRAFSGRASCEPLWTPIPSRPRTQYKSCVRMGLSLTEAHRIALSAAAALGSWPVMCLPCSMGTFAFELAPRAQQMALKRLAQQKLLWWEAQKIAPHLVFWSKPFQNKYSRFNWNSLDFKTSICVQFLIFQSSSRIFFLRPRRKAAFISFCKGQTCDDH